MLELQGLSGLMAVTLFVSAPETTEVMPTSVTPKRHRSSFKRSKARPVEQANAPAAHRLRDHVDKPAVRLKFPSLVLQKKKGRVMDTEGTAQGRIGTDISKEESSSA